MFSGLFMLKYRELFNEKSTIFETADIKQGYSVIQVPPNYPSYKMIADIKHWYSQKEVKMKFQNVGKGKSTNNADIVLDTHTSEDLMKRLFHTLRIDQTMPNLTNLDKYFQRTKIMNKKFVIPEIVRSNMKGARDTRVTQTNRQEFESQIISKIR